MKQKQEESNKSFFIAFGMFILGMVCLAYLVYFIAKTMSNELLPPTISSQGEIPRLSSEPLPMSKSAKECQKGNIFSCAKETFGWGSRD